MEALPSLPFGTVYSYSFWPTEEEVLKALCHQVVPLLHLQVHFQKHDDGESYQEALEGKTDYKTASVPKKAVEEPLEVAENWTNNLEVEGVAPKAALDEILANIEGRDISNEDKRKLKAEAYNRVYSEMVNAGITLSFTDFSLIVLGEN